MSEHERREVIFTISAVQMSIDKTSAEDLGNKLLKVHSKAITNGYTRTLIHVQDPYNEGEYEFVVLGFRSEAGFERAARIRIEARERAMKIQEARALLESEGWKVDKR